jgi:hypothetical protein
MTDESDRPEWLPAPTVDASSVKGSPGERAAEFLVRLPSLVLIALGIGSLMLAVTAVASPRTIGDRSAGGTAVALTFIAGMAFGVAAIIRFAPHARLRGEFKLKSTTATAVGPPMTTQQFFGALLRAVAIWQLIEALVQAPQLIAVAGQFFNVGGIPVLLMYAPGPIIRAALGCAVFVKADWLARLIYPDRRSEDFVAPDDKAMGK